MSKPSNVVFDIGRVLIEWDMALGYPEMDRTALRAFLDRTGLRKWNERFDAGVPFADGVAAMTAEHPDLAEPIARFDTGWAEMVPGPIEGSVDVLRDLESRGVPLYAITNFSNEKWPIARERFPFLRVFRDAVVSGAEGVIKPDPRIFEILLERNGLDARDCVFVDDLEANVEAAAKLGFDAIVFTGPISLRRQLAHRGLLDAT